MIGKTTITRIKIISYMGSSLYLGVNEFNTIFRFVYKNNPANTIRSLTVLGYYLVEIKLLDIKDGLLYTVAEDFLESNHYTDLDPEIDIQKMYSVDCEIIRIQNDPTSQF